MACATGQCQPKPVCYDVLWPPLVLYIAGDCPHGNATPVMNEMKSILVSSRPPLNLQGPYVGHP